MNVAEINLDFAKVFEICCIRKCIEWYLYSIPNRSTHVCPSHVANLMQNNGPGQCLVITTDNTGNFIDIGCPKQHYSLMNQDTKCKSRHNHTHAMIWL